MMLLGNPPTTPRRVKVYELRNNDWFDRGTGYCTGSILNDEAHIQVKSEEEESRLLLDSRIVKDDGYQKQQETLIVWTEPLGTDMALSFQEPEGCAAIWEFVSYVQNQLAQQDELEDNSDSAFHQLPNPELGNLAEIEMQMRTASSNANGRDILGKHILNQEFIQKLIPLLEVAEDLESITHLHSLCNIMKMIILLNDTIIVEKIVQEDLYMGVVGILEYDPDFPSHKANHRQFLGDKSKFKQVVPIRDPTVEQKIHQTYRLQYMKDVVLARILDDPTFSVLNSLIFFNQFDIVLHLQSTPTFLKELFDIFSNPESTMEKKKQAVLFIQNTTQIAKTIQATARIQLYANLINNGLFGVIDFALMQKDPGFRIAGTDILVALIDHDPLLMRQLIYRQISNKEKPLTHTLIELLLGEPDLGVKAQIADAIRVLLDHSTSFDMHKNNEMAVRLHARSQQQQMDSEAEGFLKTFYEESAKKLFAPLRDLQSRTTLSGMSHSEVSLFTHLVETLCFFVRHHSYRSKYFLLTENLPARVAQLLSAPEKHLKLTALKFFRTCVGLKDEFYIRHITKNRLLGPILNLVLETMPKDNLINSASLEFFEFIRRDDDLKALINNLVENHRPVLETITYVPTFTMLLQRYDQKTDVNMLPSQFTQKQSLNGTARWRGAAREMDPDEEAYFNTSDDEGEGEEKESEVKQVKIMNGSPNLPLVEYGDDTEEEDEEEIANYIANGVRPLRPKPESSEDASDAKESIPERPETPTPKPDASEDMPSSSGSTDDAPVQPPKRRRGNPDEDEDEDALNKLSRNKRRSPAQGAAAQTQAQGQTPSPSPTMGRKRSFNLLSGESQGNGRTAKKIAISLKSKDGEKDTPSPTAPTAPAEDNKDKEEAKEKEEPKVESKLVLKELPEERELAEEKEVEEQLEKEEVVGDKENEKENEETKDTPQASASDSETPSGGPEASDGTTEPASTPLSTQKAVEPASS